MMPVSNLSLLKSVAYGTVVGWFTPVGSLMLGTLRISVTPLADLKFLWLLLWVFPAPVFALGGAGFARRLRDESVVPYVVIGGLALVAGAICFQLLKSPDDPGKDTLIIAGVYALSMSSAGWCGCFKMRQEMSPPPVITPEVEEAARARFHADDAKADTDAVRTPPCDMAEEER